MNQDAPALYVSHVRECEPRYEAVKDHLSEVAEMASEFAMPFGVGDWAYAAGLLHDVGKYSDQFQRRILFNGPRVDHATAGAFALAHDSLGLNGNYLSYCVAGHHGGMPDGDKLIQRFSEFERGDKPSADVWCDEVPMPQVMPPAQLVSDFSEVDKAKVEDELRYRLAFLTRMTFSCLVDADYLCTERFMNNEARESLSQSSIESLRDRHESLLSGFYPPTGKLNTLRCGLLDECLGAAYKPRGIFTLTAPTGAGKTHAFMRFALNHAVANGMRRVIVAQPFTALIEQTADVYRAVFGSENILEHHSNFDYGAELLLEKSSKVADGIGDRLRLAAENWDAPIVVTTNVQLFESLYSNKPSRCRKLHNIAGSVIILDEAQALPSSYLIPCIKVLAELVRNYGCSVVLSSATQPVLDKYLDAEGYAATELCQDVPALFSALNRVTYERLGRVSDDELAEKLLEQESALCIVNSRKQALNLYELLKGGLSDDRHIFCLTTLMYPQHRKAVLRQINDCIKQLGQPCIVVATSLIEAGVDLDFPTVFRAVSGVDSMVQAAGRCNREGKLDPADSHVYLFESGEKYVIPPEVRERADVSRGVLGNGSGIEPVQIGAPAIVHSYFEQLVFFKGEDALDKKKVVKSLSEYAMPQGMPYIPFDSVAQEFKLIEDGSYQVIIPGDEIVAELDALKLGVATRSDMRSLARHSVSLYEHDLKALLQSGDVAKEGTSFVLANASKYSFETGLDVSTRGGEALFW